MTIEFTDDEQVLFKRMCQIQEKLILTLEALRREEGIGISDAGLLERINKIRIEYYEVLINFNGAAYEEALEIVEYMDDLIEDTSKRLLKQ